MRITGTGSPAEHKEINLVDKSVDTFSCRISIRQKLYVHGFLIRCCLQGYRAESEADKLSALHPAGKVEHALDWDSGAGGEFFRDMDLVLAFLERDI